MLEKFKRFLGKYNEEKILQLTSTIGSLVSFEGLRVIIVLTTASPVCL